jgi:hypothetical protein
MLTLGFFSLLRPGEYAATSNPDAAPFQACDVHVLWYQVHLDAFTCSEADFHTVTHIALEFTTQKNGVKGELVGLGRSGHPLLCPVFAALSRLKHMRLHNAPRTTPLYTVFSTTAGVSHTNTITTTELTQQLRTTCSFLGDAVGLQPCDISVRSLRSSGAMALLCADVDTDKI